jgi:hypothetical protein
MRTTYTALDELEIQAWHNCTRNGVDMKEATITRSYARALLKHYDADMPMAGRCIRLDDARGLTLHNHGVDVTIEARWR